MKSVRCALLTGTAATLLLACLSQQARAVDTPSAVEPGQVERRFRIDQHPEMGGASLVPQVEETPVLSEESVGPRFELKGIKIQGGTAFAESELESLYHDQVNSQVTLGDVRAIANRITAHYRNAGYILSRAIVPPQEVADGVVTIQVVEGYIDGVSFEGAEEQDNDLLASYAAHMTGQRPITNAALERYLLLIDDVSGLTARGVLSPSETSVGASHLTVALDYAPVEGEAFVNNRGSRFLGPIQAGVMAGTNSLLGLSERLQLRGIVSSDLDELRYYEASYLQPIGDDGTTLRALASYTDTAPGASLKPLDIEGESVSFSLAARHPFLRSRRDNLFGNLGVRYRDSASDILSTELYDDHMRSAFVGLNYDTIDSLSGINRIDAELAQGFNVLDGNHAGDLLSRANGENSFTRIELDYSRLQPLTDTISAFMGLSGQYAFDPLLASEEFSVGGEPYGSAYDPSEISGDSGFSGRLEMRYSDSLPESWVDIYQFYAFYDGGKVYNRSPIASESADDSLTSAGVGVRVNLINNISATAEIAQPLTRDVAARGSDGDAMRGFFSLVYSY